MPTTASNRRYVFLNPTTAWVVKQVVDKEIVALERELAAWESTQAANILFEDVRDEKRHEILVLTDASSRLNLQAQRIGKTKPTNSGLAKLGEWTPDIQLTEYPAE